ncbi:hypothetical protein [Methylopila sp. M107]|uniref:hypothetical protein n=1 Tax=Methylopila sp. M107 TaxID=1101190 RepID=UPI001FD9A2A1|nr:hypothetical protein [Methylopila sp. M107]
MIHIVLTWSADKRGKLRAETPMKFKTALEARGRAERSAGRFAAVVALSQGYDVDTEQADENPVVLFRSGRTPAEFEA